MYFFFKYIICIILTFCTQLTEWWIFMLLGSLFWKHWPYLIFNLLVIMIKNVWKSFINTVNISLKRGYTLHHRILMSFWYVVHASLMKKKVSTSATLRIFVVSPKNCNFFYVFRILAILTAEVWFVRMFNALLKFTKCVIIFFKSVKLMVFETVLNFLQF